MLELFVIHSELGYPRWMAAVFSLTNKRLSHISDKINLCTVILIAPVMQYVRHYHLESGECQGVNSPYILLDRDRAQVIGECEPPYSGADVTYIHEL